MENRKTLALLFLAAITSFGISIGSAFAATAGTWGGTAEFGTFELVVNADGTGIERINYSFSSWTCGSTTMSGGIGIIPGTPWPISGGEFSFTNYFDPGKNREMTISGLFESPFQATGTWQAVIDGTNCDGIWQALFKQSSASCNVNLVSSTTENAAASHEACEILGVGPDFVAEDGASIFLSSGLSIWFMPGFSVEPGATLKANVCGQSLCKTSNSPMPYGCHSCVDQICDADPSCCDTGFDQACVDMVDTVCGLICE